MFQGYKVLFHAGAAPAQALRSRPRGRLPRPRPRLRPLLPGAHARRGDYHACPFAVEIDCAALRSRRRRPRRRPRSSARTTARFRRWVDRRARPAARARGITSCEMCQRHLARAADVSVALTRGPGAASSVRVRPISGLAGDGARRRRARRAGPPGPGTARRRGRGGADWRPRTDSAEVTRNSRKAWAARESRLSSRYTTYQRRSSGSPRRRGPGVAPGPARREWRGARRCSPRAPPPPPP